jgi:hypothetical protein
MEEGLWSYIRVLGFRLQSFMCRRIIHIEHARFIMCCEELGHRARISPEEYYFILMRHWFNAQNSFIAPEMIGSNHSRDEGHPIVIGRSSCNLSANATTS